MKLNNNKVLMRNKEGKPKPEKMIDLFRIFYYLVLIGLFLYVVYYFVAKSLVIKGEGFVTFDIVTINSPYTGIVKDLNITKHIKKGQFLCNIQERIKNTITTQKSKTTIMTQTQILNLKVKIDILKTQYKAKKDELKILQKEYNKLLAYNSLELYNPNSIVIQNLRNKISKTKIALKVLKVQIRDYQHVYNYLPQQINSNIQTDIKSKPLFTYIKHPIYSLTTGDFIEGVTTNNIPTKAMNLLFKIQTYKNLRIVGYFSQKYIDELAIGDEINILIAKHKYKGKILHITTNLSELNFKTLQKLKVIIAPIEGDMQFWKEHNLLRVKLRKYKW